MPVNFDDLIPQSKAGTNFDDLVPTTSPFDYAKDVAYSAGSGLVRGAADLAGLPGTLGDAFNNGMSYITGLPRLPQSPVSGQTLRGVASAASGGATDYHPQTTPGKFSGTAAEFVPGALAFGGGTIANAVKYGVIPGLTSEAAGQVTEGTPVEPYARFVGGLLAPSVVGAVKMALPNAARTEAAALAKLGEGVSADNLTPAIMQQRLADSPDLRIADLGPNLQGQTAALANLPGANNQTIRTALEARNAGSTARVADALNANLGPRVIPSQADAAVKAGQRLVGEGYEEVMKNASAVDTKPLADMLDSSTANLRGPEQAAVKDVRSFLNIPGTDVLDPHPGALFSTREAIDGLLKTEQNGKVIRQLTIARNHVDDLLSKAAPGIKDVDAQYAELARQREALTEGQSILDSGRTTPRPEDVAQRVQQGALPQGTQIGPSAVPLRLSQGTRAEIDRIVGTNTNDVAAINKLVKGEGDWNRAKLVSLFGQDRTDRILKVLENETAMQTTRNKALVGSPSAERLQFQNDLQPSSSGMSIKDYYGAGGVLGAARGAGLKVAEKLTGGILAARSNARNSALAENLISPDTDSVIQALIQQQNAPRMTVDPRVAGVIASLLARQ